MFLNQHLVLEKLKMAFDYQREYHRYKKYYFQGLQNFYQQPITQASLGLALSLATVSFFAFFALKPTLVIIANLMSEIKTKKEVNQKLEQKVNALNQAQASFAKAEEAILSLDKTLPKEVDFLRFVQEIEYLSFKNNIVLSQARFDQFNLYNKSPGQEGKSSKSEGKAVALKFKFTLAGSWQNLKNFLADLENLDRLVVLEKISFSVQTGVEGAELQITLAGNVYYFPAD